MIQHQVITPTEVELKSIFNEIIKSGIAFPTPLYNLIERGIEILDNPPESAALPVNEQDRNFEVRLKARIDKKMQDAGFFNALLDASNSYEDYSERKQAFFDSLDEITLEQLQGKNQNPLPVNVGYSREDMENYGKQLLQDISTTFLYPYNQDKAERQSDKDVFQALGETLLNFPLPAIPNQ